MKLLTAFSLFTLFIGFAVVDPAFAVPRTNPELLCHSTGVADAGFNLRVARDARSALLGEITFAGPRPVAQLSCSRLFQMPGHPDSIRNYLLCRNGNTRLGNLVVRLYAGGFGGRRFASVRKVSFNGGRVSERELRFGRLDCN